jgi:hypothetical protein
MLRELMGMKEDSADGSPGGRSAASGTAGSEQVARRAA